MLRGDSCAVTALWWPSSGGTTSVSFSKLCDPAGVTGDSVVGVTGAVTLGRVAGLSLTTLGLCAHPFFPSLWHVQEQPRWLSRNPFQGLELGRFLLALGLWLEQVFRVDFPTQESLDDEFPGMQESSAPG